MQLCRRQRPRQRTCPLGADAPLTICMRRGPALGYPAARLLQSLDPHLPSWTRAPLKSEEGVCHLSIFRVRLCPHAIAVIVPSPQQQMYQVLLQSPGHATTAASSWLRKSPAVEMEQRRVHMLQRRLPACCSSFR
eukprot:TRINITY_DN12982_c0_g1_i1.p3 TRINITY_DN12982_c0_g1~~TRINITY_DN12982_c0_g1_i1.p3  ORF type:complete len:135 (+),score=1.55 TRINITY_DN12982_c0_g1_i1:151-555(+)